MSRNVKIVSLILSSLSVYLSIVIAINVSRTISRADNTPAGTQVIPIFKTTKTTSDTIQLKHFLFATIAPAKSEGGTDDVGGGDKPRWPFKDKSPSQFRRIDQGWDLQYHQKTPVLAPAGGKVSIAGNDPGGFGVDYPLITLDEPVCGFKKIYIGHVHVDRSVLGKHVDAGGVVAHTDPNGVNSPSNWAEPGFWGSGGPAGNGIPSAEGYMMKNWMLKGACSASPS